MTARAPARRRPRRPHGQPRAMFRFELDNAQRSYLHKCRTGKANRAAFVTFEAFYAVMVGLLMFEVEVSRAHLAERTGLSERQITRHVDMLVAARILAVTRDDPVHTAGQGWRRRHCNRYRLVLEPRKARSPAGDTRGTRSNELITDCTPAPPLGPVDGARWHPPDPPTDAERAVALAAIAKIRAIQGW